MKLKGQTLTLWIPGIWQTCSGSCFIFTFESEIEWGLACDMGAFRHQKRVLDLLQLELQVIVT